MNLGSLVARLGLGEVARRVGVSPVTVKRWLRSGVSARYLSTLQSVLRRHLASKKSYETRQRRAVFPSTLPLPPEAYVRIGSPASGHLGEGQILPNRPPVETKSDLNKARKRAGYTGAKIINTPQYRGESHWVTIGEPILEVDIAGLASNVVSVWKASGRTWCHVVFLLFRYIPYNPIYKGELASKQGKWFDWWTSTSLNGDEGTIRNSIEVALSGAVSAGYSRVIWLEAMNIRTFDNKADLPTKRRLMRGRL